MNQHLIDDIMDNFNFGKVAKVMQALEWRWHDCEDPDGIPMEYTLRKLARRHLKSALVTGSCGSGGFNAQYKNGCLSLSFVVEDWDCCEEKRSAAE